MILIEWHINSSEIRIDIIHNYEVTMVHLVHHCIPMLHC